MTLPAQKIDSAAEAETVAAPEAANDSQSGIEDMTARLGRLDGLDLLRAVLTRELPGQIALVSSFGAESAVLLAMAAEIDPAVPVIFLDTGKLFGETITYRNKLVKQLGLTNVLTFKPDPTVEGWRDPQGALWRDNPDACCAFRKVEPLERALSGYAGWITGRKRFQSKDRAALPTIEVEDGRIKINPLANWGAREIEAEFQRRALPRHPLVADGYLSIGCMPCTTKVAPGGDARSGRWAGLAKTECGIHLSRVAAVKKTSPGARRLKELENESIFILREAFAQLPRLAMLWSVGKDSNVLIWLARKAFFGRVPFPVVELDTGMELPAVYKFRDRYAAEWGLDLKIETCPPLEDIDPGLPPLARAAARKSAGLIELVRREKLSGVIVGIRRDEQSTRAKERVFSPRSDRGDWDIAHQPAEFWDHYKARVSEGEHVRVHPLLNWSELDIWRYTKAEGIPVASPYLAKDGLRYRSLGERNITQPMASTASSIDEIIAELEASRTSERAGRSMDHEAEDSFERLRSRGYM
jgi:sulfate adenylyltransferase subunit 2